MKFDVRFAINRMPFRLMHDAVDRVAKRMVNPLMILPGTAFAPLPPLADGLPVGADGGFAWANRLLNEEQRLAVREVVRGAHVPLPYLIYGPPGTGKTSTLAEAAVQVWPFLPPPPLSTTITHTHAHKASPMTLAPGSEARLERSNLAYHISD